MKIVVVGTGYVGLTQGVCLSSLGHEVVCVDINEKRIEELKNGKIPFFEEGLEELLKKGVKNGLLSFDVDLRSACSGVEIIFICVQTPENDDGSCDLSFVNGVLKELDDILNSNSLVVVKSTVPPGSKKEMKGYLNKSGVEIASNPEFLRQGTSVKDFLEPSRIVLGVESKEAEQILRKVYGGINAPIFVMSVESAQLVKYTANSMLALRLSFMNEIANIADAVGADVRDVELGIGSDPRIGSKFLRAGAGFGGSCFPKDVLALARVGEKSGYKSRLIAPIIKVNNDQTKIFIKKAEDIVGNLQGKNIVVWGLAFNKGTDDLRESPAIKIVKELVSKGAKLSVFDPKAQKNAKRIFKNSVAYMNNLYDFSQIDAMFVLTEWEMFKTADWGRVSSLMHDKIIFDGKNFLDHDNLRGIGFKTYGMGMFNDSVKVINDVHLD